jgi:hypothetical protein
LDSLPRRRALAALHGALLAAWWAAWAYATVFAAEHGWWQLELTPRQSQLLFPLEPALVHALAAVGLTWFDSLARMSLVLIGLGAALGFAMAGVGQLLRADQHRLAWRAIVDTVRQPRQWLTWLGLPFAVVVALLSASNRIGHAFDALLAFAVAWTVAAPFFVLDRLKLMPTSPSRAPLAPRWPGMLPLLWAVAAWLIGAGLRLGSNYVVDAIPLLRWPLGALDEFAGVLAGIYFLLAWLDGVDAVRAPHRLLLSWPSLSAFAVLELRLAVISAWFVAPLLALFVSQIYIWPQLEEFGELHGALLLATRVGRFLMEYWWLASIPILLPLSLAVSGRVYVALFPSPVTRA